MATYDHPPSLGRSFIHLLTLLPVSILSSLCAFNLPGGRQMFAPLPLDRTTPLSLFLRALPPPSPPTPFPTRPLTLLDRSAHPATPCELLFSARCSWKVGPFFGRESLEHRGNWEKLGKLEVRGNWGELWKLDRFKKVGKIQEMGWCGQWRELGVGKVGNAEEIGSRRSWDRFKKWENREKFRKWENRHSGESWENAEVGSRIN